MKPAFFKILTLLITHVFLGVLNAQEWSEPVNISNLGGINNQPDFFIVNDGIQHVVWAHKYSPTHWKIFYSKSEDDGLSWSLPEDVSLNDTLWVSDPHIVSDTENNLYFTYDHDVYNPSNTNIYFKKFDGQVWNEPILLSENMAGAKHNHLAIDNYGRVYCFWYQDLNNGTFFYRYLENDEWSEIFVPFNNNNYHSIIKAIPDIENNLHCIGRFHYEGQTHSNDVMIYFYYDYLDELWSDFTIISNPTLGLGSDISLNSLGLPQVAYGQKTPGTLPGGDSTVIIKYDGINWMEPELVDTNAIHQQIEIDEYSRQNIFNVEETANGSQLVHFYKSQDIWEGILIEQSEWYGMAPISRNHNNKLYISYYKGLDDNNGDIFFSMSDIITQIKNEAPQFSSIAIYPNPFKESTTISFDYFGNEKKLIMIYDLSGNLVFSEEIFKSQGNNNFVIVWDGNDNSKEYVKPGIYLVRIQAGRKIITRRVEYIK